MDVEADPVRVQKCTVSHFTGHSVHEVHGFEYPAKTIFANNLKTIDLRVVYYVYLSLAQLSWSKKCAKCICTIDNIWNKAKKIFANWGLSSISMDFVYWATCSRNFSKINIFRNRTKNSFASLALNPPMFWFLKLFLAVAQLLTLHHFMET